MTERVTKVCSSGALTIKTFHAFALSICKEQYRALGFSQPPRILDDSEKHELIKNSILKLDRSPPYQDRASIDNWDVDDCDHDRSKEDSALESAISYFSRRISSSKRLGHASSRYSGDDRAVMEDFEQMKTHLCCIDQDDSIPLVIRLFKSNQHILALYQSRHQYILVDEFQDVSPGQMQLIKLLVLRMGASSHSGCHRITVCGDQDQSIYGFLDGSENSHKSQAVQKRGTVKTNFDDFLEYWPSATVVKLQRNYRSTGHLVRAGSALISKNGLSATSCSCETSNAEGPKLLVINASSEDREVQAICDTIERFRANGVQYQHMCILFRVRTIGKAFQRELTKRKIPTVNSAPDTSNGPYRKALAMDLLAYLRVAVGDSDPEAFKRCINRPGRGLGKQALEKLVATSKRWSTSLWTVAERCTKHGCDFSPTQKAGLAEFVKIINSIKKDLNQENPDELPLSAASRVLRNIYDRVHKGSAKAKPIDDPASTRAMLDRMIDDMELLTCDGFSLANSSFENVTKSMLSRFAGLVGKNPADLQKQKGRAVVTLSTVHQAKGLEFQHVFLVRFNDSFFPLPIRPGDGEDEESFESRRIVSIREERRLAYVAVTRAQFSLHISWVTNGQDGMLVSRFIDDLPSECLQNQKDADLESEIFPALRQSLPRKDSAHTAMKFELESTDSNPRTKTIVGFQSRAIELSSPSPSVLPNNRNVDDERKNFLPRGGWDPSLPTASGLLPNKTFGSDQSPCHQLLNPQRSEGLRISALETVSYRTPATVKQKRSVQFLETQGDEAKCCGNLSKANECFPRGQAMLTETGRDESQGSWKSGMKTNVMMYLPNLLQSHTECGARAHKRDREEIEVSDGYHEGCNPTSVQDRQTSLQGRQTNNQSQTKRFVPSFLLDSEDEEEEEERGNKVSAGCCSERTVENPQAAGAGPLNFSWGRGRKPSLLIRRI